MQGCISTKNNAPLSMERCVVIERWLQIECISKTLFNYEFTGCAKLNIRVLKTIQLLRLTFQGPHNFGCLSHNFYYFNQFGF